MTASGLAERFASLGDKDLKKILEETSGDYTPEALKLAQEELASRGVAVSKSSQRAADSRADVSGSSPPPLMGVLLHYIGIVVCVVGPLVTFIAGAKAPLLIRLGVAVSVMIPGLLLLGQAAIIKQLNRIVQTSRR